MPRSPEFQPDVSGLWSYLERALPGTIRSTIPIKGTESSLMLYRTPHLLAAFAVGGRDVNASYLASYSWFKKLYKEKREEWRTLDLAFVFCVPPDVPGLDHFRSRVETDVYFCRKFVIPLTGSISHAVSRLPFLPLAPIDGASMRPASAQTFLRQCGIGATLARYLAVQHSRGPERIIEDCLEGSYGEPSLQEPTSDPEFHRAEAASSTIRLDSIQIENFRAYRGEKTFHFGSAITVLYGPNGFGKTSFFDAIDFAVTGGIGRLERDATDRHLLKVAPHLDSTADNSVVTLHFHRDDTERTIRRTVSSRRSALLDDEPADRKEILSALTAGSSPATDRVENYVDLFRATHLFNQEQQELTRDFRDDCSKPAAVVSRMLAFEDYANAIAKASKVCDLFRLRIETHRSEITRLEELIAELNRELLALKKSVPPLANPSSLEGEISDVRSVVVGSGIALSPKSKRNDIEEVRGWRALVEASLADISNRKARIEPLTAVVADMPSLRARHSQNLEKIKVIEKSIADSDQQRTRDEAAIQKLEAHLSQLAADRQMADAVSQAIEWVTATKPTFVKHSADVTQLRDSLASMKQSYANHRKDLEQLSSVLGQLDNATMVADQAARAARDRLEKITDCLVELGVLRDAVTRRDHLQAAYEAAQVERAALAMKHSEYSTQLRTLLDKHGRVSRNIADIDDKQTDFRALLSQLHAHIDSGVCPLCGEDQGTREALFARIDKHIAEDAASSLRIELVHLNDALTQVGESVGSSKAAVANKDSDISALEAELQATRNAVRETEDRARSAMPGIEPGSDFLAAAVAAQTSATATLSEASEALNRCQMEQQSKYDTLEAARIIALAKEREIERYEEQLAEAQTKLSELSGDERAGLVPLNSSEDHLRDLRSHNDDEKSRIREQSNEASVACNSARASFAKRKADLETLRDQLHSSREQQSLLYGQLSDIEAQLAADALPQDISAKDLVAIVDELSQRESRQKVALDRIIGIELAVDAATTAAAFDRMARNIKASELELAAAKAEVQRQLPWMKYFQRIEELVQVQQDNAIQNFTRDYGPRTSVIQRRLRSVYGFDDIELKSDASSIVVRALRNGEELRPTDYFSQSQQQTLLLGLFLTACTSQTWSAFSTILLDDPVTHFDDLNTYALLDLILGLIDTEQFVISTCDEKLFQLARQKFRRLGKAAKFYQFTAIGPDGPSAEAIES